MFGVIMENDIIGNENDNLVITHLHRKREHHRQYLEEKNEPITSRNKVTFNQGTISEVDFLSELLLAQLASLKPIINTEAKGL